MVDSDGARLARLEERVTGVREDLSELVAESQRNRVRLHNLEGIAQTFSDAQREARRAEVAQYRRLELRVQLLTLVVGFASIVSPILVVVMTGK